MPGGIDKKAALPETKNQHYVPQIYLKRFADSKGAIFAYDKQTRKSFRTNVKNIASENYFYDSESLAKVTGDKKFIEKHLSQIEGKFREVSTSLLDSFQNNTFVKLDAEPRYFLAVYMIVQMYRTKESRIEMTDMAETLKTIQREAYTKAGQEPPPDAELFGDESVAEIVKDIQSRKLLDGNEIQKMAGILDGHIWVFRQAFGNECFLTSDHPLGKRPHITDTWRAMSGIGSEGIEIVFPLSSKYLLIMVDRKHFKNYEGDDGKLRALNQTENMVYYNQFQVYESTRFVFSEDGNFSLVDEILSENPIHGDPQRKRIVSS